MSVIKYIALLLVLIASVIAEDCSVSVQQQQRTTWVANGVPYSVFDVQLQNKGTSSLNSLVVRISSDLESFWELQSIGDDKYTLPEWRAATAIAVGEAHQLGYIIKSDSPADFTIVSCDGEVVVTPTAAPTARPSVAPTTRPSQAATTRPTQAATTRPTQAATSAPTQAATAAPTQAATAAPTQAATAAPTQAATSAPTKAPTTAPTKAPTSAPTTKAPTVAPTKAPTSAPTTKAPTKAPTQKPTSAPTTKAPTAAPTAAPTKAPTTAPTNAPSAGGKICPAGTWWQPAPLTTWQWVISTTPDTSLDVQMYDIDLFSASTTTMKKLHDAGRAVICYFSTQYEDWRPDAKDFPSSALGNDLDDWHGERWVDIRNSGIRNVMKARLDLAVSKGCDGVEPDNVDGYKASTGFPLTAANQLEYNKWFATEAHARGLSIGLKNDLSQVVDLQPYFDWALNEECYQYNECNRIKPFIDANKAVFSCEYSGSGSTICPYMNNLKFSGLIKEHLDNSIKAQCCDYLSGGCGTKASYRCVSQ